MFLERYQRSVMNAIKIFRDRIIPFSEINFELLTLCYFRESLGFEYKRSFQELLTTKVKPFLNEILECEAKLN